MRELPKTMLAAKSFERTGNPAAIARWLRILAEELADRLAADGGENARRPRSLSVTYRRAPARVLRRAYAVTSIHF